MQQLRTGVDEMDWQMSKLGQWNTFKEMHIGTSSQDNASGSLFSHSHSATSKSRPVKLCDIPSHDDPRIDMHDNELNRVLGGGLVAGSIVLLEANRALARVRSHCRPCSTFPTRPYYMSAVRKAPISLRCEPNDSWLAARR